MSFENSIERNRRKLEAELRGIDRKYKADMRNLEKEQDQQYKEKRKQKGIDRDTKAKDELESLSNILNHALKKNAAINWGQLKDTTVLNKRTPKEQIFNEQPPELELPPPPKYLQIPAKPDMDEIPLKPPNPKKPKPSSRTLPPEKTSQKYQPVFGFLDQTFPSRKVKKIADTNALFQRDYAAWVAECTRLDGQDTSKLKEWEDIREHIQKEWEKTKRNIDNINAHRLVYWEKSVKSKETENINRRAIWESDCDKIRDINNDAITEYEKRKSTFNKQLAVNNSAYEKHKNKFYEQQKETNAAIDEKQKKYMQREKGAVANYCDAVLTNSIYPDYFPKKWDLDYNADTRILVVEYLLPPPEVLPALKGVQYVQTKDEFKETCLSEKEREVLYDTLLYQIALRTIHEQFKADKADALDVISFNGLVTAIDKSTGKNVTACVLSVMARKEQFMQINLAGIDPKTCFKSLKGVSASKLAGLTPIAPVMMINKNDRRFVTGYGVADYINQGTNLATMDWEDFEHLVREVFEQEFAGRGGEVKVTQSSRDGGVDAVAFDPDPITGGKIIIQAKCYANTVGVSAVRDLFGTVDHEGAMKGILVTTSDYGADSYEFAKGKPLTLINGSQLLSMMQKHGHKARINLNEARQENRQALLAGIGRKRGIIPGTSD